jgi:hypothetical protein
MGTAIMTEIEKPETGAKVEVKPTTGRFKTFLKKLYNWSLIDGDVFLESKDWPYLWKK